MNRQPRHLGRALGRPLGAFGIDASIVTAAIAAGTDVVTSAIPVIATAVDEGNKAKTQHKKHKKKKAAASAKKVTTAPEDAVLATQEVTAAKSSVPWTPIAIGGVGLLLAALLWSQRSNAAAKKAEPLAADRTAR